MCWTAYAAPSETNARFLRNDGDNPFRRLAIGTLDAGPPSDG